MSEHTEKTLDIRVDIQGFLSCELVSWQISWLFDASFNQLHIVCCKVLVIASRQAPYFDVEQVQLAVEDSQCDV